MLSKCILRTKDYLSAAQVYDGNMRLSIEAFVHWGVSTVAAVLVSPCNNETIV